jgi:hypothetical protein
MRPLHGSYLTVVGLKTLHTIRIVQVNYSRISTVKVATWAFSTALHYRIEMPMIAIE